MKKPSRQILTDPEERASFLNRFFPYIYFAMLAYCCVVEFKQFKMTLFLVKPLISVLLINSAYINMRKKLSPFGIIILISLFTSALADLVYTGGHSDDIFFIFSMGFYIITRIIQAFAYGLNVTTGKVGVGALDFLMSIPYIIWCVILFFIVKGKLGQFTIVIVMFLAAIALFGIFSIMRNNHTTGKSFQYTFIGTLLVTLFDSLLILAHFFHWRDSWVGPLMAILTYTGQFLIVQGVNHHVKFFDIKGKQLLSESLFPNKPKAE